MLRSWSSSWKTFGVWRVSNISNRTTSTSNATIPPNILADSSLISGKNMYLMFEYCPYENYTEARAWVGDELSKISNNRIILRFDNLWRDRHDRLPRRVHASLALWARANHLVWDTMDFPVVTPVNWQSTASANYFPWGNPSKSKEDLRRQSMEGSRSC